MINVLIRCHNRPALFERCLQSVRLQTYKKINIIISKDCECNYIPAALHVIEVIPDKSKPYFYDLYCNELKSLVTKGWFLFLDEDDYLAYNDVLERLPLDNLAILVQINHIGHITPLKENFGFGQVGMSNLILHHSLKELAHFTGEDHNDYHYVKEVCDKIKPVFIPMVVVECDRRGLGA